MPINEKDYNESKLNTEKENAHKKISQKSGFADAQKMLRKILNCTKRKTNDDYKSKKRKNLSRINEETAKK